MDFDPVASSCPRPCPLVDDRGSAVNLSPREDRRLSVVAVDSAAEFGFVTRERDDLLDLCEFDDLQPRKVDGRADRWMECDAGDQFSDNLPAGTTRR